MDRKTSFPEDHWTLQVDIPYSMGLHCSEMIYLCGQADLKGDGQVCNAGDLLSQSKSAFKHIDTIFQDLGASLEDLVKLVVFYVADDSIGETEYIIALAAMLPTRNRPVITLVPVPRMFYPGLMVEIDAYGMHGENLNRREVAAGNGFSAILRSGEMIFGSAITALDDEGRVMFADNVVAQSHIVLERLAARLAQVGAQVSDLVKINNWYVAGGNADDWAESAKVRAGFYPDPGPCATGIPLPGLNKPGALMRTDFWAMLNRDGSPMAKTHSWPEGHWDWPIYLPFKHGLKCGNLVFLGGQVSMNAEGGVVDAGQMETQTRTSMDNIGKVLAGFGLNHADIVKLNTHYQSSSDKVSSDGDDLHSNVTIRGSYFEKPGPASTGIPFPFLAYEGMLIEIEAIAMSEITS
ncbi:MAG: enamine deaminase RidA (YjgF/YER057c/UK114 family) [Planctomycetota bacterium]|jgi:enamine deaminase RidA (YjgF/YER057c/UK114 family)